MRLSNGRGVVVIVLAFLVALTVISPALGGPSLKNLVKKEVKKQLAKKQGPAGQPGTSFDANATLPSGRRSPVSGFSPSEQATSAPS